MGVSVGAVGLVQLASRCERILIRHSLKAENGSQLRLTKSPESGISLSDPLSFPMKHPRAPIRLALPVLSFLLMFGAISAVAQSGATLSAAFASPASSSSGTLTVSAATNTYATGTTNSSLSGTLTVSAATNTYATGTTYSTGRIDANGWYTEPASIYGGNVFALGSGLIVIGTSAMTFSGSDLVDSTVDSSSLASGITPAAQAGSLSGGVSGLKIKLTDDKSVLRVKATVSLRNTLDTVARHVTATVYLSDDATLSSDDINLRTLKLADYVPKGKIRKGETLSMPFNQKVPAVLASYVAGKYLIVVLSAGNLDLSGEAPIVVGPIKVP